MKNFFLVLILFLIVNVSDAQQWLWAHNLDFGSDLDRGTGIGVDKNKNVYVTGDIHRYSHGVGPSYYYQLFLKFDSVGNLLWQDTIPFGFANSVTDSNGFTFIISGNKVVQYDSDGNPLWITQGPVVRYTGMSIYPKGGVVLCGFTNDSNGVSWTVISRFNQIGSLVWNKLFNYGSAGAFSYDGLTVDRSGNIYSTAAWDTSIAGVNNGMVDILDSNGVLVSSFRIPNTLNSQAGRNGIVVDSGNFIYLYGYTSNEIELDGIIYPEDNYGKQFITKYDQLGNVIWNKFINPQAGQPGCYIAIDKKDNLYLCGRYYNIRIDGYGFLANSGDIFVAKFDKNGVFKSFKSSQGESGSVFLAAICTDNEDGVYLTGDISQSHSFDSQTLSPSGMYPDMFVAKLKEGNNIGIASIVQPKTKSGVLSIYPNPSNTEVVVQYDNRSAKFHNISLNIRNLIGQIIYSETFSSSDSVFSKTIDVSGFAKGIYFVQASSADLVEIKKLVLE